MRPRLWMVQLLLAILIAGIPSSARADGNIIQTSVEYTFNQQITFHATFQADQPIEKAFIFFQAENDTRTNIGEVTVTALETTKYALTYVHPLTAYALRTFSQVEYRYEITLRNGGLYKSPSYQFYYEDNRFDWQSLEEAPFVVHWYVGDITFAQNILDVAQAGILRIQSLLTLPSPEKIKLYIYPDSKTLQDTLRAGGENWVAGHADPDLNVIVVALPQGPDQRLLMEQRIPHELMHILLYHYTKGGYENLPTWLNEGLASLAELYPNPDYRILLENAAENDRLLPMTTLCHTFPRDASSALLAYAQAASFTQYLHHRYGISRLMTLIEVYANGLDCDSGVREALGIVLTQLERQWQREALAENVLLTAFRNLLPWLVVLIAIMAAPIFLILFGLRVKSAQQPIR